MSRLPCSNPLAKKSPPARRRFQSRLNFSRNMVFRQYQVGSYNSVMPASKTLPPIYRHQSTLDLSSSRTMLLMNLAAIPLLFVYGWLFGRIFIAVLPTNPFPNGLGTIFTVFSLVDLFILLVAIVLMLVLHEMIHGLFFWLFTAERPKFALRSGYAFAAAPGWYLPKFQYIIVGLAPLLVISILCLVLAALLTPVAVPYLLIIATFNAAGALGDVIVVIWVLMQSNAVLVRDQGDKFSAYTPSLGTPPG